MSQVIKEETKCFVCGNRCEIHQVLSTNTFGPPDLDTRPAEMTRSIIIEFGVGHCPSCDYCAPDISTGPELATKIIKTDEYSDLLKKAEHPDISTNPEICAKIIEIDECLKQSRWLGQPEFARKFLCSAIVLEAAKQYDQAGWDALKSAWAFDDCKNARWAAEFAGFLDNVRYDEIAIKCRKRALKLFHLAQVNGMTFAEGIAAEEAIMCDLYRRTGDFEMVMTVSREGLDKGPVEMVERVLLYQQDLARKKDAGCHTLIICNKEVSRDNRKERKGIMLATHFDENLLASWNPPFAVQPMLKGVRCRAHFEPGAGTWLLLSSTEGSLGMALSHIVDVMTKSGLPKIYKSNDDSEKYKKFEYDGILYSQDLTYEELCHIIKRRTYHDEHKTISFYIFDLINTAIQANRFKVLDKLEAIRVFSEEVRVVPYFIVNSADDMYSHHKKFIAKGYAGTIIRDLEAPYVRERSTRMLKLKSG